MYDFLEDWPDWSSKVIAYGVEPEQLYKRLSGYDKLEESNGMCVDVQG